jgi:hypothetical protein
MGPIMPASVLHHLPDKRFNMRDHGKRTRPPFARGIAAAEAYAAASPPMNIRPDICRNVALRTCRRKATWFPLALAGLLLAGARAAGATNGLLTLDAAIATALAQNPGIREAAWQADERIAERDLAQARRRPTFAARASYDHYTEDQRGSVPNRFLTNRFGIGCRARPVQTGRAVSIG